MMDYRLIGQNLDFKKYLQSFSKEAIATLKFTIEALINTNLVTPLRVPFFVEQKLAVYTVTHKQNQFLIRITDDDVRVFFSNTGPNHFQEHIQMHPDYNFFCPTAFAYTQDLRGAAFAIVAFYEFINMLTFHRLLNQDEMKQVLQALTNYHQTIVDDVNEQLQNTNYFEQALMNHQIISFADRDELDSPHIHIAQIPDTNSIYIQDGNYQEVITSRDDGFLVITPADFGCNNVSYFTHQNFDLLKMIDQANDTFALQTARPGSYVSVIDFRNIQKPKLMALNPNLFFAHQVTQAFVHHILMT